MINIETIVKRYNESISEIAEYNKFRLLDDKENANRRLRHAAELMSESLEFAVKYHFFLNDRQNYNYMRSCGENLYAPKILGTYYWDTVNGQKLADANMTISGIPSVVDFDFMISNKRTLNNGDKHNAELPSIATYEDYKREVKIFIHDYLDPSAELRDESYYERPEYDNIQYFYSLCEKFRRNERRFILLVENNPSNLVFYRNFNRVQWDVIVDFNMHTMDNGLCQVAYAQNMPTHIFTTNDIITEIPRSSESPILYMANGFRGVKAVSTAKEWSRLYYRKVETFFEQYGRTNMAQETIVVSLMQDARILSHMIDIIDRYVDGTRFIVANDPDEKLVSMCSEHDCAETISRVPITMGEIDTCLADYLVAKEHTSTTVCYKLPCLSKVDGVISKDLMVQLEEYFEVLYEGIGEGTDGLVEDFLSGASVLTWEGAKRDFAVENPKMKKNYYRTIDDMIRKGKGMLTIVHDPGFGGTTVARQIAYHYHDDNPVLFMKQYNADKVKSLLKMVHDHTKKTILVFMEIPSVISFDDMRTLYNTTNQTYPFLLIGIRRGKGSSKTAEGKLVVNDWGNDVVKLRDKYFPYIERFTGEQRAAKEAEIQSIMQGDNAEEEYKRTPFYFGFLAFEEKFQAMPSFLGRFVKAISNNEAQRKALIYITIMDRYAERGMPDSFMRIVFGVNQSTGIFHLEDYFMDDDGVIDSLLITEKNNGMTYRKLKYPFFGEMLLRMLLTNNTDFNTYGEIINLGNYCKLLIEDVSNSVHSEILQDYILKNLFIGTSRERTGDRFTRILNDIQKEDRINIFLLLHDRFPENPHFASHLARYYALEEKNFPEALKYADEAIGLSVYPDALLHHIKGTCLSEVIKNKISEVTNDMERGVKPSESLVNEVIDDLFPRAEEEYKTYRDLFYVSNKKDEYGYLPNIRLLLNIFDFYVKVKGKTKAEVISSAETPFIDWLDDAQSLLEDAKTIYLDGEETEYYTKMEYSLWDQFGNMGQLISNLNNKLDKGVNPQYIRRQISRIYLNRDENFRTNTKEINRVLTLMEENINIDPENDKNFYIWFAAARFSSLKVEELISKVTAWHGKNPSIEVTFLCYVLNVINAFHGSTESATIALKFEKELKETGKGDIRVREWYGDSCHGVLSNKDFKNSGKNPDKLYKVKGYVSEYLHVGAAYITSPTTGLRIFFRPSENDLTDMCLNHNVEFSFGFSYDGLRAHDGSVVVID